MENNEIVEEFEVKLRYIVSVDTSTGEVRTECISKTIDKHPTSGKLPKESKKSTRKKKKKEESSIPQLTLEENKYSLNTAAVELLNIEAGDKLNIEYEKYKKNFRPVLILGEGNKVTKSNTVACRGSKYEELSKFGSIFEIVKHPSKPDAYLLNSDGNNTKEEEIEEELPIDIDLPELVDNDDDDLDIEEIDPEFFNLD